MCQRHYKTHLPGLACTIAFAAVLLVAGSAPLYGQTRPAPPPPDDKLGKADKDDLGSDIGSHESEMRAKLALITRIVPREEVLQQRRPEEA